MDISKHRAVAKQRSQETVIRTKKPTARHSTFPWKSLIIHILVWTMTALLLIAFFDYFERTRHHYAQSLNSTQTSHIVPALEQCEPLPPHGTAFIMDPSVMNRTDVRYSGLEIQNNYNYPMVAILSDAAHARQMLALFILPENGIQISVPIGHYGMHVLVGSKWCNLKTGFSDGAQISLSEEVSITPGSTSQLQFYGSGLDPIQLALAYHLITSAEQEKIEASEIIGEGQLELKQTRDGHYFSSGAINGSPLIFMIDTGATVIAISAEMAARAGIKKCTPHLVITANGKVRGCVATAAEITFGPFTLADVTVSILPSMPGEALLGMNVLRNFHIEQIDNTMRISSR